MRLVRHLNDLTTQGQGTVVALGNFDGLHRGHQVVLGEAGRKAKELGISLSVMVTEPHPVRFFAPDVPPFRLTPFRERADLLGQFGVDHLLVLPFDQLLAGTPADDFITSVLVEGFGARHVVVGYDYRFGSKRSGDTNTLRDAGLEFGFDVTVIDQVTVGIDGFAGEIYSSTLIRDALTTGRPRRAAALLGHWWTISGRVLHGDKRGRTIGFPTANVQLGERIEPKRGVYAVRVMIDGEDRPYSGVANFGARPTFDKKDVLLEVHLFDFDGDLYDRHLDVELVSFLRPEQKFDGLDHLKGQIAKDCETAKIVLEDPENVRDRLLSPTLADYLRQYSAPHPCVRGLEG